MLSGHSSSRCVYCADVAQTDPARIVVITCRSGLEGSGMHLADMNFKNRLYDAGAAYHQSKLALAYFAMELAIRFGHSAIRAA